MRHLLLLAIASATAALSPDQTIKILRIGFHHQDEVGLGARGIWHALVVSGSESYLKQVNVTVKAVNDPMDDDVNTLNGREVIADITPNPILLVRGDVFQSGNVDVLSWGPLEIPLGKTVTMGSAEFSLQIRDSTIEQGQRQFKFGVLLRVGGVEQAVATYSAYSDVGADFIPAAEHFPSLVWVGDLDGDQQVDFLLDTSDHYNVDEVTLFLSSQRSKGDLVKAVAFSRRVGC